MGKLELGLIDNQHRFFTITVGKLAKAIYIGKITQPKIILILN